MDKTQYDAMIETGIAPCGCPRVDGRHQPGDTATHAVLHGDSCTIVKEPSVAPVYPSDELETLRQRVASLEAELSKKAKK